ncbi:glycoside hydrolase family 3 C-terminal domain-containing protein [Bacteroides ovatus]|nr:glycoside hydrolase family 3 C-terminal domain-containing protein [Bacteroides ovatus]
MVGPFASDKSNLLGRWSMMGKTEEAVSVEEGLKEVMPQTSFNVAGCPWGKIDAAYIASAVKAAEGSDVVVACLGENKGSSGEAVTYAKIELPEDQVALLKALKKTGKKIVTVLFNGRPLALTNILNESDAILEAWHPGTMGGKAVALLLSGQENPSGKLTQTFPRHCGQVPLAYNERRTFQKIEPWDLGRGPLFPFGFGLSYTKYEYSDLKVNTDQLEVWRIAEGVGQCEKRG